MAHDHAHGHNDSNYYLEQLCMLGVSGLMGFVSIMLYRRGLLATILAAQFFKPVLLGGITLVVLVVIRAFTLWQESRTKKAACDDCGADPAHAHDHHHDHDHGADGHTHDHAHEHTHDHDHDHVHNHDHAEALAHAHDHDHDHDHGHDHGWNPWRYIVLLLPVVLYFLGLPNEGLSAVGMMRNMKMGELDAGIAGRAVENTGMRLDEPTGQEYPSVVFLVQNGPAEKAGLHVKDKLVAMVRTTDAEGKPLDKPQTIDFKGLTLDDVIRKLRGKATSTLTLAVERDGGKKEDVNIDRAPDEIDLQFKELERAAFSASSRAFFDGKIGKLKGQYIAGKNDHLFSLARIKITCCAAHATMLNVSMIVDPKVPSDVVAALKPQEWIQVQGEVQFRKKKGTDEYAAVLLIGSAQDIKPTTPDANPYVQ